MDTRIIVGIMSKPGSGYPSKVALRTVDFFPPSFANPQCKIDLGHRVHASLIALGTDLEVCDVSFSGDIEIDDFPYQDFWFDLEADGWQLATLTFEVGDIEYRTASDAIAAHPDKNINWLFVAPPGYDEDGEDEVE